jgi:5-methylthioadenosine/S-adenosylhomocysteine deaminase
MSHLIGSLVLGKRADITVVELGRLHSAPRYTYAPDAIYSHLVYSARSSDVRDVVVDGKIVMRDRVLQTLDEEAVIARAQAVADRINTFLAGREQNLFDKLLALGGIAADEIFEVQVKAHITAEAAHSIAATVQGAPFTVTKASERTQYDTYFFFGKRDQARIRLREDHRTDIGARMEAKYTITLTAPPEQDTFPSAIVISRARFSARANHTQRFYREYLQPETAVEISKQRRRWRILYKGEDFALNLDVLTGKPNAGPFLELKSRTWSRRDADTKAALIGEMLALFGVDEGALVKQEYVEL